MWTLTPLFILGLNLCQATTEGSSTQMYYMRLIIEDSAIKNLTERLGEDFVKEPDLQVQHLNITTVCVRSGGGSQCVCESGYRWSDKDCDHAEGSSCTFPTSTKMCVHNSAVAINGSLRLGGSSYQNCLRPADTTEYKTCHTTLFQMMKSVYSTLPGFDTLEIIKYRVGSVIVEFVLVVAQNVRQQDLIDKSDELTSNLTASLDLESSGLINLIMPDFPVCFHMSPVLTCELREALNTPPVWQLSRGLQVTDIVTGTEATVTSFPRNTTLTIKHISELWEGVYSCAYNQGKNSLHISHKASALMDIALLPDILISTKPEFPLCAKGGVQVVKVLCEIGKNTENYTVKWINKDLVNVRPFEATKTVFKAEAIISCENSSTTPEVTCIFENRCKEKRLANTTINIIHEGDMFCEAEGDWGNAKAGFTARLRCTGKTGHRYRKCTKGATGAAWEPEESCCVNQDLDNVLKKALNANIGLGSLNANAADVFSQLDKVTNNSQRINSHSNLNASVQVLSSLSTMLQSINDDSTADNFFDSSSNLLEKSLKDSWTKKKGTENLTLAERYLSSVEKLISVTNVTRVTKKKNIEVAVSNCTNTDSQCNNKVFNVSVVLESSDPGNVKTAGFKELEKYLPLNDKDLKANSIVVSTTTEKETQSVEVKIHFQLLEKRPPHVLLKCVAWDNASQGWSEEGCTWSGSSNEGLCICKHLSSFAILMQRYPLKIPGLDEVTQVGLCVSVMSLVISLIIEVLVWSSVVKTNTLYIRHTAHINISLCLLVTDSCFLGSMDPPNISDLWCRISVVLKHFSLLSTFFWMLCLSSMLMHQAVFLFHNVSKKIYLRLSMFLGYVCPLLIVVITFLVYDGGDGGDAGEEGKYYSRNTCWLMYDGFMKGSIHTFIIPLGVIVIVNMFSMVVVIMKLLDRPKNAEQTNEGEKKAAVTVMRTVILLTPIFGLTWVFGFAVMLVDLTSTVLATLVNYVFTLLNAFQGLFILLTTCVMDKSTREALRKRLRKTASAPISDSSTKLETTWKN
ncbi:hypothetical protein PBY51_011223 [Eleginops maclovinus]|uniref:Adhesion G protein-coupled receptor F5 n=1 Tax=Eleginops maclovinus TaxID=56733 RepID=A0AAN8AK19_ELEMC|nr:hypothetical protein PBY51_011223 [Eleginops maclovinus]